MLKSVKRIIFCLFVVVLTWMGILVMERQSLKDSLIRFHVVANSDDVNDQQVKLLVRDAVIEGIGQDLASVADVEQAKSYLRDNLPKIEALANAVLKAAGFEDQAVVSLCEETFSARQYETFSLPSGVYEALRIVIGEGEGKNWWCVSFPALCTGATSQSFIETASEAGISKSLCNTLSNESGCEIRFFLLDAIGKVENYLFNK